MKVKPLRIVMETYNLNGVMKNKHLSKAIAQQGFDGFIEFGQRIDNGKY